MDVQYAFEGTPIDIAPSEAARRAGRRWHPAKGWPIAVPRTSPTAYLSGYEALNLEATEEHPDPGDWHESMVWWTTTYHSPDGYPYTARLWGPDGTTAAAPGPPGLRDARPALSAMQHPDGRDDQPVYAATAAQATVDLAWIALSEGGTPPDRLETARWLSEEGEQEATRIARTAVAYIENDATIRHWEEWIERSLEADETDHVEELARRNRKARETECTPGIPTALPAGTSPSTCK